MDRKEAVSLAAEHLSNADNFIVMVVDSKGAVHTTTFIDNAANALYLLSVLKKLEHSILNPNSQASRIIN